MENRKIVNLFFNIVPKYFFNYSKVQKFQVQNQMVFKKPDGELIQKTIWLTN